MLAQSPHVERERARVQEEEVDPKTNLLPTWFLHVEF